MPDAWRITPRPPADTAAYGQMWPAEGRLVTAAEVDAGTLARLDADPRFAVEAVEAAPEPSLARPLTLVKGIGPKTAAALTAAGIDTLAVLAGLTDEAIEHVAGGLEVIGDTVGELTAWRGEARRLTEPAGSDS